MPEIFSFCDVCDGRVEFEVPAVDCSVEPSLTQQQFAEECDINRIMGQYARTGVLPASSFQREEVFGEATAHDLQSAMELVARGASAFESLDPDARAAFNNDPVLLLGAFDDPSQRGKLEKYGFIEKKSIQPVVQASGADPAAAVGGNVPLS